MLGDPERQNIKNSFVSNARNDYFSINQIIFGLHHGFIKSTTLPVDVKVRVQEELRKRHPELKTK